MKTKIILRPITKGDLEWARILRNTNREFFFDSRIVSQSMQEAWFLTLSYPFFVIEYNGKRAGTIAVRKVQNGHEVHNVLIDIKFRKKGIFKYAMELLEKSYATPLYVDVFSKNTNAIRAYRRLGFSPYVHRLKKK